MVSATESITTVAQVLALPWVGWEDRDLLPPAPGLYFVLVDGQVIYIGRSNTSLRTRWKQYPLRRVFEEYGPFRVAFVRIADIDAVKPAEKQAIRAMRPLLNFHYVEGALEHWHQRRILGPRLLRCAESPSPYTTTTPPPSGG